MACRPSGTVMLFGWNIHLIYQKDDKYTITIEGLDIILDNKNNTFTEKEKENLYSLREILTNNPSNIF